MLDMGGTASKLFRLQFCRANVLCVLNLTQESIIVQFSSVQRSEFSDFGQSRAVRHFLRAKLNSQNTQVRAQFNRLYALTPLRSVAIISVSVRSAELRLGLYV
jgi:hypothetical protein